MVISMFWPVWERNNLTVLPEKYRIEEQISISSSVKLGKLSNFILFFGTLLNEKTIVKQSTQIKWRSESVIHLWEGISKKIKSEYKNFETWIILWSWLATWRQPWQITKTVQKEVQLKIKWDMQAGSIFVTLNM